MKTDIRRILTLALCATLVLGLFAGIPAMTTGVSATSFEGYTEDFEGYADSAALAAVWQPTSNAAVDLSATSYNGAAVADGSYLLHATRSASGAYVYSPKITLQEGVKYTLSYFFGHSGYATVYVNHYSSIEGKNVSVTYDYSGWKPTLLAREHEAVALPEGYTSTQIIIGIQSGEVWLDGLKFTPACDHNWIPATTTAPKTCSICGATEGGPVCTTYTESFETDMDGDGMADGWTVNITPADVYLSETAYNDAAIADGATLQYLKKGSGNPVLYSPKIYLQEGLKYSLNYYLGHSGVVTVYLWHYSSIEGKTVSAAYDYSGWKPTLLEQNHDALSLPEGYTYSQVAFRLGSGDIWLDDLRIVGICDHVWTNATCTAPKTCSVCGETEGAALGHTFANATCTAAKTCSVCGATEGEALGHSWVDATCTAPKTCSVCGVTEGEALGHSWVDATCTAPKTCSVCGATEGEALGHTAGAAATCTEAQVCTVCGAELAPALGHTPNEVTTCEEAQNCTVCGVEVKPAGVHAWADATCTAPKTCSVCGATEGEALGHTAGAAATCTEAQVCTVCGAELAPALGHTLTAVEAKEATTEAEGNKAYWTCECGKWFADAEGTTEITDKDSVVIPKLPNDLDVPVTGDTMMLTVLVSMMALAVLALTATKIKFGKK